MSLALLVSAALAAVGDGDPPPGLDTAGAPRRVALVVGVDDYPVDPELGDLRYAAADARAMGDLLAGEGYEVVEAAGHVTTQRFWRAFDDATATLRRDDVLLVYIAGHAQLESGLDEDRLQLLFSESRSADAWSGTPLRALSEALDALPVRQRVVVIDACYSRRTRALLQSDTRGPVGAAVLPEVQRFEAWMFAAAPEQSAQEDPVLGHGVFTCYLMEALRGDGDLDRNGLVGTLEAFDYAGGRTAAHTDYAQIPRISEDRIGWTGLPLAGERGLASAAIIPWVEARFPGVQLFVDGALRGPGALEPGRHQIRVEELGRPAREGAVRVPAGSVVDVRRLQRGLDLETNAAEPGTPPPQRGRPTSRWEGADSAANLSEDLDGPDEADLRLGAGVLTGGGGDFSRYLAGEFHLLKWSEYEDGAQTAIGGNLGVGASWWGTSVVVEGEVIGLLPLQRGHVGAMAGVGLGGLEDAGLAGVFEAMFVRSWENRRGEGWGMLCVGFQSVGAVGILDGSSGFGLQLVFGRRL